MGIHVARTGAEGLEQIRTQADLQRQADGAPDRIAPPDPVRKIEHVGLVDTEGTGLVRRRRCGNEMGADAVGRDMTGQPVARRLGGHQGLLGREGLRRDHEENGFRIRARHRMLEIARIERGDKAHLGALAGMVRQRVGDEARTEIGPADTDIHHPLDRLAGGPEFARTDPFGEGPRLGLGPVDHIRLRRAGNPRAMPIGHVQCRPALRGIDHSARQQRVPPVLQPGGAGRGQERIERGRVEPLLGGIEFQPGRLEYEAFGTVPAAVGKVAQTGLAEAFGMVGNIGRKHHFSSRFRLEGDGNVSGPI